MLRPEIAKRLNSVSSELAKSYEVLALVLEQQIKTRVSTFKSELLQGSSVSHAERMAEINTQSLSIDIVKQKSRIQSLEEQRDNFRFLIKYSLEEYI